MKFLTRNIYSVISLLIMVAMSILLYPDLPDQIPTNFSMDGEARELRSKDMVVSLTPGIFLGIVLLVNLLIELSPRRFTMPHSKGALDIILGGTGVMCAFLHFALLKNEGEFEFFVRYFSYGMALFLVVVGNVWGKTERNFMLGLRVPWTLTSEANWRATHRLGGRLMVLAGALLVISNSLQPILWLTITLTCAPLLVPVIYSYYYYARYERAQQMEEEAEQL